MIIFCRAAKPYEKFVAGVTPVQSTGDVCQVCLMGEEALEMADGGWQMMAYSLAEVLALRNRAGTLTGHPLLDLQDQPGACGYIELPLRRVEAIKRWEMRGDLVGVRNYSRRPGRKDYQVARISRRELVRCGLLNKEDVLWLDSICESSHYYVETEMAKLAALEVDPLKQVAAVADTKAEAPPERKKKRHPRRRKGKLSPKELRRLEGEEALVGRTEKIERKAEAI